MCLKNLVILTSNTTPGLINHNRDHLLVFFFFVALLTSFVLRADPEGGIVSEIHYNGHTEEIPHKIQPLPAFNIGCRCPLSATGNIPYLLGEEKPFWFD